MLNAIPTPVAILILLEKNEPSLSCGIKSRIQEFQLQPETAPKADTTISKVSSTASPILPAKRKGISAIISQHSRLNPAEKKTIARLFRIFSTKKIEGSCSSWASGPIAANKPITKFDAPSFTANATRKAPPVRIPIDCDAIPSLIT
jgi:hypothetical protein